MREPLIPNLTVSLSLWFNLLRLGRRSKGSRHLAAARRVGQRLVGDGDDLVFETDDLAQVDVLDRVVRLRQGEPAARAVDLRGLHRTDQLLPGAGVALDR